jgi:eukaryotic-like serine/threonine-protein kinase
VLYLFRLGLDDIVQRNFTAHTKIDICVLEMSMTFILRGYMDHSAKSILKLGTILNEKWVILEFIGRGGMGEVYRAHQITLKRDVAIKVISREWLSCIAEDEQEMETAMQRFEYEVRAMAQLRHPNVLQVFDYGSDMVRLDEEDTTIHYIVMEYIPGNTLRETMSDHGFEPEEELMRMWVIRYFLPILDGVEAIHKADMVHRDLKPENFLIHGDIPKIADFGIARSCRWRAVTNSIDIKGTIMYMPPEQFMDFRRADHRADIYSLGKILYEAATGRIRSQNKRTNLKSVGLEKPETPFFQKLDNIIRMATAEEKEKRLDSIEKLRSEILHSLSLIEGSDKSTSEAFTRKTGFHSPAWIWTGIVIAVLSMVLMTLWHLLGEPGRVITLEETPAVNETPVIPELQTSPDFVRESITTEDGSTMLSISGGEVSQLRTARGTIMVDPFYLDKYPVTNQQYVEFLNEVSANVNIANNVVLGSGNIWLLVGEIVAGYDPIAYRNGRFVITHSGHAACPVLRVTAFGAEAYAEFYGKRLPTEAEWLHVYRKGNGMIRDDSDFLPIPTPVILFDENRVGIRGLNQSINEWVFRSESEDNQTPVLEPEYLVIGNIGVEKGNDPLSVLKRLPWEAFGTVGFRSAKDVPRE